MCILILICIKLKTSNYYVHVDIVYVPMMYIDGSHILRIYLSYILMYMSALSAS